MAANQNRICTWALALLVLGTILVERSNAAPQMDTEKRVEKRSISIEDLKRAGAASFMSALENSLGSMQRPRFGKRFVYDGPYDDDFIYNDKRGSSYMDLESALGSMQRPRFGRSVAAVEKMRQSRT